MRSDRLSGAAIAISRARRGQRVGPFDECYRLYFEETDWLLRLEAAWSAPRGRPRAPRRCTASRTAPRTSRRPRSGSTSRRGSFASATYGRWFARLHDRGSRGRRRTRRAAMAPPPRGREDALSSASAATRETRALARAVAQPRRVPGGGRARAWRRPRRLAAAVRPDAREWPRRHEPVRGGRDGRELGRWWIDLSASAMVYQRAPTAPGRRSGRAQNRSLSPIVR